MKWLTRQSVAWAGYDVASSVYIGIVPAVLMPLYFRDLLSSVSNPTAGWGLLAAAATFASGVAALLAAAVVTRVSRFRLLQLLSIGLVAAIAALGTNPGASVALAAAAFIAAQCLYFAATTIYESFLPDLQPPALRQRLSGFGWSIGYVGGGAGILAVLAFVAEEPQSPDLLQGCFLVLAGLSGALFVAVLVGMHRSGFLHMSYGSSGPPVRGVADTLRHWRQNRGLFGLLVGSMLVQAAVSVVVTFTAPILASRFGQDLRDLLWLLLLIHVLSVPSTMSWSRRMGPRSRLSAMTVLLGFWALVLLLLAFGTGAWLPLFTVTVIGCCLGATLSALRGFLAESVAPYQSAAFFGFATVSGRVAAALGPALFAVMTLIGGETTALVSIVAVLACGGALVLIYLVREPLTATLPGSAA